MAGQSINQDENSTLLQELALRLLRIQMHGDPDAPGDTQLMVGTLPATLPVELPLPDGCRVLGSLVRPYLGLTVVLDCTQTSEQILDFYRERMTAAGWSELEMPHRPSGFEPDYYGSRRTYCFGARGPALNIQALQRPGAPTEAQLNLQTDPVYSPCAQRHRPMGMNSPIPSLSSPPGSRLMPRGSGGGNGSWHSEATLDTDLEPWAIAEHFASLLERAGWARTAAGRGGPLAWSTWTFHDSEHDPWSGLLLVLKRPATQRSYLLSVRVDADTEDGGRRPGGGGWSTGPLSSSRSDSSSR
jgi:hypothetical protein